MVTTKMSDTRVFVADIVKFDNGSAMVTIYREDGVSKIYQIPEKKIRLFKALDTPVKDAIEFLLG